MPKDTYQLIQRAREIARLYIAESEYCIQDERLDEYEFIRDPECNCLFCACKHLIQECDEVLLQR